MASWHKIDRLEEKDLLFMSAFKEEELFKSGKEDYEWILQYPWIETNEKARDWDRVFLES